MSDLTRTCPGCDSHTSAIGIAFREDEPCPYCGLPASAAAQIDDARERGATRGLTEALAKAEVRAAKAEQEVGLLRGRLARIALVLRETEGPEGRG